MRRLVVTSLLVAAAYAVAGLSHAALPALAAFGWAVDAIPAVVVQSVGRQAVLEVGVAANEAAFAATATSWANSLQAAALVLLPWIPGETLEVPVTPTGVEDQTHAEVSQYGETMTTETATRGFWMTAYASWKINGQQADIGGGTTVHPNWASLKAAVVQAWNAQTLPAYHITEESLILQSDISPTGEVSFRVPSLDAACQALQPEGFSCLYSGYSTAIATEAKDGIRRVEIVQGGWLPDTSDPDWTAQEKAGWSSARSLTVSEAGKAVTLAQVSGQVQVVARIPVVSGVEQQAVVFDANGIPVASAISRDTLPLGSFDVLGNGQTTGGSGEAVCGGPGLPDCAVKINEEGVQTDSSLPASNAMDAAGNAAVSQVTNAGNKTVLPFLWSPTLPQGVCEDVTFNVHGMTTTVDWCQYLGMFRQLIGWLYGLLAALYCWRKVTEAY